MKNSTTVLSALALASASLLAPSAFAGKIENLTQNVALVNNQATVEHLITGGNKGQSFTDRYNFTTSSEADLNAILFPRAKSEASALSITGFTLFDSNGKFVANSTTAVAGDGGWLIDFDNLAAGAYYLQVNGSIVSNGAVKYLASLNLGAEQIAAIPEPAPVGLMLAGLGVLGMMARRRVKAKPAA